MSVTVLLEVGGSHVLGGRSPDGLLVHRSLDDELDVLPVLLSAVAELGPPPGTWAVAMPGPFDPVTGAYGGPDKLPGLRGLDLRAELLRAGADDVVFVNDADAFALGSWDRAGRPARLTALTLGSGVGSGWVADGHLVLDDPSVPPLGSAHLLEIDGQPLEETFSRPALRRAFTALTGLDLDVREICAHPDGPAVLVPATRALGATLRPWLRSFGTEVLVVGGSIARSWYLLAPWFADGLGDLTLLVTADTDERTALRGAALAARR